MAPTTPRTPSVTDLFSTVLSINLFRGKSSERDRSKEHVQYLLDQGQADLLSGVTSRSIRDLTSPGSGPRAGIQPMLAHIGKVHAEMIRYDSLCVAVCYHRIERLLVKCHECGPVAAYSERPAYRRNDFIGWINRAKRENE